MSIPAPQLDVMQKPSSKQKANKNAAAKQNNRYDKKNSDDDFGKKPGGKNVKLKTPVKPAAPKPAPVVEEIKSIVIPETLTIKELADHMKKQPSEIVKKLFMQGKIVTINQEIDFATAEEIAMEFDILCEQEVKVDVIEELLRDTEDAEETMITRPPVVCVMGHVDHGKTSLLDAIRTTSVTAREAGGITQHIGAYTVEINDRKITFLDTPGHEAFTAMRMRGAQSTDIAVLVVAADDGVKPQTVEAINHAKAAGVEIVVAINKIDKPAANVEKVKQELTEYGLIPEDWGGSNVFVPVSAKSKEGIEDLLEMILLTADVMELKSNPNRLVRGLVIEAQLDKGKGPVATVLVQKGTLHVGDFIAAGSAYGKVKAMTDDKGRRVKEAGPSIPVEIMGLDNVPNAGEVCVSTATEKEARHFAETFIKEGREKMLAETKAKMSLDDLFSQIQAGNLKELNLIVKADVQGSVEAVKQSLLKLSNEEVVVKIIHSGVGNINESDVTLASTSSAIIIGFNVRPDATAKSIADTEKVDVRLYRVIYQAIEDIEAAMKGMLDPIYEEKVIGHAMVRAIFKASGVGNIAGSYVTDGKFVRNCKIRITREGKQIYEGALASLKRLKDDVKEVAKGFECGMVFDGFGDLQEDDLIEGYIMVEVPR
jgi:translation initiation factor IF-2